MLNSQFGYKPSSRCLKAAPHFVQETTSPSRFISMLLQSPAVPSAKFSPADYLQFVPPFCTAPALAFPHFSGARSWDVVPVYLPFSSLNSLKLLFFDMWVAAQHFKLYRFPWSNYSASCKRVGNLHDAVASWTKHRASLRHMSLLSQVHKQEKCQLCY